MKYVYVLVSSNNDYYAEECIISVKSLLQYNNNAEICIFCDQNTVRTFNGIRKQILSLAHIISVEFESTVSQVARSRLLKTTLLQRLNDDFVFVDTDTVIADEFVGIEDILNSNDISMVLDGHTSADQNHHFKMLTDNARKMRWHSSYQNKHFNSGVMVVKNSKQSKDFFELWHQLYLESYKKGINIDQLSLNEANYRMGGVISELDGRFNVQVNCGLPYVSDAVVIHYLSYRPQNKLSQYKIALPFLLCNEHLFLAMRKEGEITDEIKTIIENPKRSFQHSYIIPDNCSAFELIFSNHFRVLRLEYGRFKILYEIAEKVYGFVYRIIFRRV